MAYLTIGEIKISTELADLGSVINKIKNLVSTQTIVAEDTETASTLADMFEKILPILETLTQDKNILDIENLTFAVNNTGISATYTTNGIGISVKLNETDSLTKDVAPTNAEDLDSVIAKAKSVKEYVEGGKYSAGFTFDYNGLTLTGTIQYNGSVLEIANVEIAGEKLNIRIQNKTIYIAYGNMKLKYALPTSSGETSSSNWKDIISKLVNDAFGVDIQFGVFEEVLEILQNNNTPSDYINNMLLKISGTTNNLSLSFKQINSVLDTAIAQILLNFTGDDFTSAQIKIYDIASISLNLVSNLPEINMDFDESEYKTDFVEGLLDSTKVQEDMYAFASDLAVRYSTNTFYGQLVAMLIKNETGKYVPAISLYTTSLGLSSYIYLIDNTIYIDIQGLQLKADLSEATIDEVMEFVETKLGISLSGEAQTASEAEAVKKFMVVLPALDKIYGQWVNYTVDETTYNGLQVNFRDGLQYMENGTFHDIVVQAFLENYENTIMPTKIILGANIEDPNTIIPEGGYAVDKFEESWLENEEDVTKQLNFGVYFTNISVGTYIEKLENIFKFKDETKEIEGVKSNYTSQSNFGTNLADFNDLNTLFDLVGGVYDFGTSMHYNVGLNATIDGKSVDSSNVETSTKMTASGSVLIAIDDLPKDENGEPIVGEENYNLFDGKKFKVQSSGLNIKTSEMSSGATDYTETAEHIISLLYGSDSDGLYVTYSHDNKVDGSDLTNNIGSHEFKARIANTSMSDIVSMILGFANIKLSDEMMQTWHLEESTTDFSFIQSLLGLGEQDTSDTTSKVDQILHSVTAVMEMIENIKLEKVENEDGLCETTFSIQINLASINSSDEEQVATIKFVTKEEIDENATEVKNVLRELSVSNLIFGGSTINLTVSLDDYDFSKVTYDTDAQGNSYSKSDSNFDYDTTATHIDFSELTSFVDAAVSTMNTQNFTFTGTINANVISIAKINIETDIYASISETGEIYMYAQFAIEKSGISGIAFSGSFDKRYSIMEFKGGKLYLSRFSQNEKTEGGFIGIGGTKWNKIVKDSISKDVYESNEIIENISDIIRDAFGFSDTIMNIIVKAIGNIDAHPTLERALLGYTKDNGTYKIDLNGENLLGVSGAKDMTLTLGTQDYNGYINRDEKQVAKTFSFIDTISTSLNLSGAVVVDLDLGAVSGTSKTTELVQIRESYSSTDGAIYGNKTLYSNDYYRNVYINKVGGLFE